MNLQSLRKRERELIQKLDRLAKEGGLASWSEVRALEAKAAPIALKLWDIQAEIQRLCL